MEHGLGPSRQTVGQSRPGLGASRRAVTRGGVWAAPVVAIGAAAPAYAASGPCLVRTNFDDLTPGQPVGTLTFPPSDVTGTLTFSSTPGNTGEVAATSTVPSWNYVEIEMLQPVQQGKQITVTLVLSQPVENLSFKLHDIDSEEGGYRDTVVVHTPGYVASRGANIQGAGSAADPLRPVDWGDTPIASGLGDVELTWAGPVQTVSFTYVGGLTGNSQNQHIGLGNISFTDCVANPDRQAVDLSRVAVAQGRFSRGARADLDPDPARDN